VLTIKNPFVRPTALVGKSDDSCVLLSPGPRVKSPALVIWVHRQSLDGDILNELDFELSRILAGRICIICSSVMTWLNFFMRAYFMLFLKLLW
jgi:hypothetical protein